MPKTAPRRRAERHHRGTGRTGESVDGASTTPPLVAGAPEANKILREELVPGPVAASVREIKVKVRPAEARPVRHGSAVLVWLVVVAAGLAALVAALADVGPSWLDGVGAVAVVTAYAWGLAARTGGRPLVFGALALVLGVAVLAADNSELRTGAAVLTCGVSAVLAVMVTTPAVRFLRVVRECVVAVLVASVGALATIGFAPVVSVTRFEYVTLGLSLVLAFVLVHRLGAGLHGLGSRGIGAVLIGGVLLALTLLYAEMLRRYGPPGLVDHLLAGVRWSRHHLGAFPRPIETVLGVPALAWGCHMRARRRQGWWLCAFGVAATAPVASSLVNPAISLRECGLSVLYGLVIGLVLGYAVIRADLAVTRSRGEGGRRLEEAAAIRPEPPRTVALL